MDDALGLASAAGGIEHEEHVFTVQGLRRTNGRLLLHRLAGRRRGGEGWEEEGGGRGERMTMYLMDNKVISYWSVSILYQFSDVTYQRINLVTSSRGMSLLVMGTLAPVLSETNTFSTQSQSWTALSTVSFSGIIFPPRIPSSVVITTLAEAERERERERERGALFVNLYHNLFGG